MTINDRFIKRYNIKRAYSDVQGENNESWININFADLEDGSSNNAKAIERAQEAGDIAEIDMSDKGIMILVNENNF